MEKVSIYVDMDGVLVDLNRAAMEAHGFSPEDLLHQTELGMSYDMLPLLSWASGKRMTSKDFWEPIEGQGYHFWTKTKPALIFEAFIDRLDRLCDMYCGVGLSTKWYFLTNYSHLENVMVGKRRWIQNKMGSCNNLILSTDRKYLYANENSVLFDDDPNHIKEFHERDGLGLLHISRMFCSLEYPEPSELVNNSYENNFAILENFLDSRL